MKTHLEHIFLKTGVTRQAELMRLWTELVPPRFRTCNQVLIFAMCILGWSAANYRGWTVWLFGAVPLPDLAAKGTPWAHTAGDIHDWLLYVLAAVLLFHIGAALYHYFFLRDRVLQRMLPH